MQFAVPVCHSLLSIQCAVWMRMRIGYAASYVAGRGRGPTTVQCGCGRW